MIAVSAAAVFVFRSQQQTIDHRTAQGSFDQRARETATALGELRSAQQAYVAAGQSVAFWMPKVEESIDSIEESLRLLRDAARAPAADAALDQSAKALAAFSEVDERARGYLKAGQPLMAADVIFAEGAEAAASASRQVEAARLAEREAQNASDAAIRKAELSVGAAAALLTTLAVLLLAFTGSEHEVSAEPVSIAPQIPPAPIPLSNRAGSPVLKAAAELCVDIARVRDLKDLYTLLGRAADVMDASGIVVWWGDAHGGDLRPTLSYGYSPQTIARMPTVPIKADNAAAAAYRTGRLQIVPCQPGDSIGAVVAPIVAGSGTIGAFSAEIRAGGELSDAVQALASLVAAQLSTILADPSDQPVKAAASS